MTIKDMHYDFKKKLNKIDSQQYKNLRIPEIDWVLNEAAEIFVKNIAEPRVKNRFGFELNQRSTEDIRNIITSDIDCTITDDIVILPNDYWYWLKGNFFISKGSCQNIKAKAVIQQHDDRFENSSFYKSSFEWREVNMLFIKEGIKFFTDETFSIDKFVLSYIKRLSYMHNAEDFNAAGYNLPSGETLTGTNDCELLPHTHREIVDLAVLITTGELKIPNYQLQLNKLKINNLK